MGEIDITSLEIKLTEKQLNEYKLKENIEKLKSKLVKYDICGFSCELEENSNTLVLTLQSSFFESHKHNARGGGRRKAKARSKTETEKSILTGNTVAKVLKYSDIVYLLSQGKDLAEMLLETGMKQATYYRHLKALKESLYFKSLDLENQESKPTLESLEKIHGNRIF